MNNKRIIIYTDLDGTLLDHQTYSFAESLPTVVAAKCKEIPIIFCSSKTRAETEYLRREMNVTAPFIVENGSAMVIPADYLAFFNWEQVRGGAPTIVMIGMHHRLLVEKLRELQAAFPGKIVGFSDMTEEEVARDCGLTLEEARRAKQREFDEPFKLVNADAATISSVMDVIRQLGLFCSQGGRYYHLHGNNDKGAAVRILNRLLWQAEAIFTVGLGDSLNDLPMLEAVDYPVLVKRPDGSHHGAVVERLPGVHLTEGIGPSGWSETVMDIISDGVAVG